MTMSFATFSLDLEEDLPPLNCIDLFPNPPTQINESNDYNIEWDKSNQTIEFKNKHINMSTTKKAKCTRGRKSSQSKEKLIKTIVLPTPSSSPSVTSNCSSAESAEEEPNTTTNLLKRKRKRCCQTCNSQFRKTRDFMSHLRGHVVLPFLIIKKLNDDNKYVQQYLHKIRTIAESNAAENFKDKPKETSLKLKLKISGSNNHKFHVVRDEKDGESKKKEATIEKQQTEEKELKEGIRILRADEIKQSKSPSQLSITTPPVKMLENMQIPTTSMGDIKPILNPTENRYFECPPLDGLDQFSGEVSSEAAEDLLQKLLHCNQTDMTMNNPEIDWSSNSAQSEFISIDRLGHICNICNANFVDNAQLFEHKQITGHECLNTMNPPVGNLHFSQHRHPHPHPMHSMNINYPRGAYSGGMGPPPSGYPHNVAVGGMVRHNGLMYPHNEAQLHLHQQQNHMAQMQGYGDRPSPYMVPTQQLHPSRHQQEIMSRRPPPPLYRVPGAQLVGNRPLGPIYEQQMIQNEGYPQNYTVDTEMMRSGQFLKTKMQKVGYPGVGHQTSNSPVNSPSPPMVMGQQTSIRPKFLVPPVRSAAPHIRTQLGQSQAGQINRPSQVYIATGPQVNGPASGNRLIPRSQAPPLAKIQNPVRVMGPASRVAGPSGVKIIQSMQINRQPAPGLGIRIPVVKNVNVSRHSNSPQSSSIQPLQKRIKLDATDNLTTTPRTDGFPVIKSVVGGAVKIHSQAGPQSSKPKEQKPDSPIQFNDQITLSLKNREAKKNPKEVASILATRGIIVTQKGGKPIETTEAVNSDKTASATQEAVQKLQLNNSVSIISKKKSDEQSSNNNETETASNSNSDPFIACPVEGCEEKFLSNEMLSRHTNRDHKNIITKLISAASTNQTTTVSTNNGNVKAFKCKFCPALFSSVEGLQDHQWKSHKCTQASPDEIGIPIIDLKNEDVKKKLAALGITNYIPLAGKTTANSCFGFPIVSVQGANNPNICNLQGLGASSLLSLGPIKHIQKKSTN